MFSRSSATSGAVLRSPNMMGSTSRTAVAMAALFAAVVSQVQAADVIVDDTSPLIQYTTPTGSWTVHTGVAASFGLWMNTDTFTDQLGAKATFKFNGTRIQYLGNRGPYHGPCRINVDGKDYGTVTSYAPADDIPILLFQQSLPAGEHTITVTVETATTPNVCEIDRFIYTALDATPAPSTKGDDGGSTTDSNLGAIIGGAVGGGVALILLIIGIWLYKRRAARKNASAAVGAGGEKQSNKLRPNSTFKPTLPQVDLPAEDTVGYTGAGAGAVAGKAGTGATGGGAGGPQSPFNPRPLSQATSNFSTPPASATGGTFSATSTTGFLTQQQTGGGDYAISEYGASSTGAGYASTMTGHQQLGNQFYTPTTSPSPGPQSPALFYNPDQGQQQQPYRGPSPSQQQPYRGPSPSQQQQQMFDQSPQRPSPSASPDIVPATVYAAAAGAGAGAALAQGQSRPTKQEYAPVAPRQDYASASRREVERELTPAEKKRREIEDEARRRVIDGAEGGGSGSGAGGSGGQQLQQQYQAPYPQGQYSPQPVQQQYQQQQQFQPQPQPQQQYQQQPQPQQQFQPQPQPQQHSQQGRQTSQDQAQDLPAPPAYEY